MTARVLDEFQVLGKYRVCVLDRQAYPEPHTRYRIGGQVYEPVCIHSRKAGDTMPRNYIAIRTTESFRGSTVEFLRRSDYLRLLPRRGSDANAASGGSLQHWICRLGTAQQISG